MHSAFRRLLAPVTLLFWLPFTHAAKIEELILLHDYSDDNPADQIAYQTDAKMGAWVGFDAFTGHAAGKMYTAGKMQWNILSDYFDPNSADYSLSGEFRLTVDFNSVFASLATAEFPAGASYSYFAPPPDVVTSDSIPSIPQTCTYFSSTVTGEAEAQLTGSSDFSGEATLELPSDSSVGRSAEVVTTSYQTNIELKYRTAEFSSHQCDGSAAGQYVFTMADYRWGHQTAKFRVKGHCPGKYILRYSIGKYKPKYRRYDYQAGVGGYWTWGAEIIMDGRQTLERKEIEVTIGEDGWMIGAGIPLPILPAPESENHNEGLGYELITQPEQAEAYGINLNRDDYGNPDPNIWLDNAVVLEPTDCGCNGGGGSGGGGSGGGGPGSGGPHLTSVNLDLNLGQLAGGASAGRILLRSPVVTSALFTPASLELVGSTATTWAAEVKAITAAGALRQIRAPQTFVDIVPTSATTYEIRFYAAGAVGAYDPANPVAAPTGIPQTVWAVGPGNASGSLAFTRNGAGASNWEFRTLTGGGMEMLHGGISETHERTSVDGTIVESRKITDPVYGLVSSNRQVWRMRDGELKQDENVELDASGDILRGLVSTPDGYGGSDQTYRVGMQDVYWPSESSSGSSSSTNTSYFDGSSDSRSSTSGVIEDMDGDQKNEKLSTTTNSSYPSNRNSATYTLSYTAMFAHAGINYTKEETRQAVSPSSSWDSPGNRVTRRWSLADGVFAGKTAWEFYPDGSAAHWTYSTTSEGNLVTVEERGKPNTGLTAILYGTRSTQIEDSQVRLVASEQRDIVTNLVFASETVLERDPVHGTPTLTDRSGKEENRTYSPCCGRLETISYDGQVRTVLYDGIDREAGEEIRSVSGTFISGTRNELDALDRVRKTYQRIANGTERLISTADYDLAGNLTGTTDLKTGAVTYSEMVNSSGHWVKTMSRAESAAGAGDALEEVTISTGNRLPLEFRRNGVLITKWHYDSDEAGYAVNEVKVGVDDSESETARSVYSLPGELLRVEYPYPEDAHSENEYDSGGRLVRQTDPDGVQTLYAYNQDSAGEHVVTALDMNRDGVINFTATGSDTDRITETTHAYAQREDTVVAKTTTRMWIADGDAPQTTAVDEEAVTGAGSWRTVLGTQTTRTTLATDPGTGLRTETTTLPDQTEAIRTSLGERTLTETRKDSTGATITSTSYQYDDNARLWKITDARGTTTLGYYANDLLHTVTTPDPGTGAQVTSYTYNNWGAVTAVTHPDATTTQRLYWPDGSVKHVWGSRAYPEYRTYDRQGRLKTLTTWQSYNSASHSGTGGAVTTWNYHAQRGWLENKRDASNHGAAYTYTAAARPLTRTWARTATGSPLVTTYTHGNGGDLTGIDYSDTTPDVTHVYDRAGRLLTTTDAAGTLTRSYDPASLQLAGEAYSGSGLLSGRAIARSYDAKYRPQTLSTDGGYGVSYGYDNAGRLETVGEGFHLAKYGYKPNVGTVETVTIKRAGVERVRHQRTTDALGRITQVKTTTGATIPVQRDYTYNAANQRAQIAHEDTRQWAYGYDDLGQVTSAQKRLADGTTPLPGYNFGYTFDDIGNRVTTAVNARSATYTPNLLNHYESRSIPGAFDVRGETHSAATVTVNTDSTTRTGKDFYREVAATNASAPVNASLAIAATETGQTVNDTRIAFLAQNPESFDYDLDGNLTQDGQWDYTWDAENRLVRAETKASVAIPLVSIKKRLTFTYDAQSRRIRKTVESWDASLNSGAGGWIESLDLLFLYDGWNLLSELDANNGNSTVRSHAWGMDLSGTAQGAGGVGGLLWTNTATHTFAPSSDANGNVVAWVNTATLAIAGRADYAAFGEVVMQTGVAKELPFGFSTKYTDRETGLLCYGFRYYNPSTGRWLSRDPIEEKGGVNLYGMVGNDPVGRWDYLGLFAFGLEFNAFIPGSLGMTIPGESGTWISENRVTFAGSTSVEFGTSPYWFKTDGRGFGGGSSRLKSFAWMNSNDVGNLKSREGSLFLSHADASHRIRRAASLGGAYTWGNVETRTATAHARERVKDISPCESEVTIYARAGYPFIPQSPSIEYEITWKLKRGATSRELVVEVSGWHRGFPFYEGFVNQRGASRNSIYSFATTDQGPSVMSLALERIPVSQGPYTIRE